MGTRGGKVIEGKGKQENTARKSKKIKRSKGTDGKRIKEKQENRNKKHRDKRCKEKKDWKCQRKRCKECQTKQSERNKREQARQDEVRSRGEEARRAAKPSSLPEPPAMNKVSGKEGQPGTHSLPHTLPAKQGGVGDRAQALRHG